MQTLGGSFSTYVNSYSQHILGKQMQKRGKRKEQVVCKGKDAIK